MDDLTWHRTDCKVHHCAVHAVEVLAGPQGSAAPRQARQPLPPRLAQYRLLRDLFQSVFPGSRLRTLIRRVCSILANPQVSYRSLQEIAKLVGGFCAGFLIQFHARRFPSAQPMLLGHATLTHMYPCSCSRLSFKLENLVVPFLVTGVATARSLSLKIALPSSPRSSRCILPSSAIPHSQASRRNRHYAVGVDADHVLRPKSVQDNGNVRAPALVPAQCSAPSVVYSHPTQIAF